MDATRERRGSHAESARDASRREAAWRRRLRASRATDTTYRVAVALLGLAVVVIGLVLVPLPGPGWLIVFLGVGVWATEFHWARRLSAFVRRHVHAWNSWILDRPLWVRGALAGATGVLVAGVFWATLRILGLPPWIPGWAAAFAQAHLAL